MGLGSIAEQCADLWDSVLFATLRICWFRTSFMEVNFEVCWDFGRIMFHFAWYDFVIESLLWGFLFVNLFIR